MVVEILFIIAPPVVFAKRNMGKKSRRPKTKKQGNASGGSKKKGGGTTKAVEQLRMKKMAISTYTPDTSDFGPAPSPASVDYFWGECGLEKQFISYGQPCSYILLISLFPFIIFGNIEHP